MIAQRLASTLGVSQNEVAIVADNGFDIASRSMYCKIVDTGIGCFVNNKYRLVLPNKTVKQISYRACFATYQQMGQPPRCYKDI